ncbi:ATP-binding protein [Actinomadura viridis]|uniref:Anti-sigma regulatory factor (Ser/Thr protein kinase) n=1 Tax=Actinomadura viridis TaxID=58110 RepID=A0A931DDK9_9ACTN|nr:ATP-binding protein [Actinomadura viridis]MBG6086904.1 anti-sigma regulatory factor (Ser/Thr protein kinase) [Actinomadura viridis]
MSHDRIELGVFTFAQDRGAVPGARRWVMDRLANRDGQMLTADAMDNVELCAGEVIANAVVHGGDGKITVTLYVLGTPAVRVEVRDTGSQEGRTPVQRDVPLTATNGRGLGIVGALASRWGRHIEPATGHTVVWFEVDGPPDPPGAR